VDGVVIWKSGNDETGMSKLHVLVFQRPVYLEDDFVRAILPETFAINHIPFTK